MLFLEWVHLNCFLKTKTKMFSMRQHLKLRRFKFLFYRLIKAYGNTLPEVLIPGLMFELLKSKERG